MTPDRFAQLQQLFLQAVEVSDDRRAAWVAEKCGDDSELQRELLALLNAETPLGDPLEAGIRKVVVNSPAPVACPHCRALCELDKGGAHTACPQCGSSLPEFPAGTDRFGGNQDPNRSTSRGADDQTALAIAPPADDLSVRCFGNYEIIERIAEGGMGVVYKARQTNLNRLVALKMIRSAEFANDEQVERFYAEAHAAAKLDHPGIVAVYEIGQVGTQHFYSMALIEGPSLHTLVKQSGPLPPPRAATIMRATAEAVQFAHEHGVIHRDLKPENVLLQVEDAPTVETDPGAARAPRAPNLSTARLLPKVADFGLARHRGSRLTVDGQVMGTPSFMPPEQAEGKAAEIGPAADVYSLGATLYYLLTGRPPFQAASQAATLQQVTGDAEPVPPRQMNPDVPRDLQTICLKCLEKQAGKRYATARELVEDLDRFLNHRPILARPVGTSERIWRWGKRNPLGAVIFGLVMLIAIAAPVVAIIQTRLQQEANTAAANAIQNLEKYRIEKARAEAKVAELQVSMGTSKAAIDKYVDTVMESEILSNVEHQPLRRRLLADALAFYQSYYRKHEHSSESQVEVARAMMRIGMIQADTGRIKLAAQAYRRAADVLERLTSTGPQPAERRADLAECYNRLGMMRAAEDDLNTAVELCRKALVIREALVREHPQSAMYKRTVAGSQVNLGMHYSALGRETEAMRAFRQALHILQALADSTPDDLKTQRDLASCHNHVGILHFAAKRYSQAVASYRRATTILEAGPQTGQQLGNRLNTLAQIYNNIGNAHLRSAKPNEAVASYQRSLELHELLTRRHPTVAKWQYNLATALNNIGPLLGQAGRTLETLPTYSRALTILTRLHQESPERTAYQRLIAAVHFNRGVYYREKGDAKQSQIDFDRAFTLRKRLAQKKPRVVDYQLDLADSYLNRALTLSANRRFDEALAAYRLRLAIHTQLAHDHPTNLRFQEDLAGGYNQIGVMNRRLAKPQAALRAYLKSAEILERLIAHQPKELFFRSALASARENIGNIHKDEQRYSEAMTALQQALTVREAMVRGNSPEPRYRHALAKSLHNFATLQRSTGKHEEAIKSLRRALEVFEQLLKTDPEAIHYLVDRELSNISLAELLPPGSETEALQRLQDSSSSLVDILDKAHHPRAAMQLRYARWVRAQILTRLGRHDETIAVLRKAVARESGRLREVLERKLSLALARGGRHQEATTLAGRLVQSRTNNDARYDLCCTFAISSGAAKRDTRLDRIERRNLSNRYAGRALRILGDLARSDYFAGEKHQRQLVADPDLFPLHHRDDFRTLVAAFGINIPARAVIPRSLSGQ